MLQISYKNATRYIKLLLKTYNRVYQTVRHSTNWTSKNVRKQFLDYFIKDNGHAFVRSSPVVPYCDPTVPFVNAGMNQFKGVFLGKQDPVAAKVANSQKCIRVGGKHNDLTVVGTDGYHHTFFEMLGNWSFGDYFKWEACELAWKLITGPYGINPLNLYTTYFSGDESLGLAPDYECRDVWRSLGVSDDRIVPSGLQDNFWEMGSTGPCGPCTEIHIDHTRSGWNRAGDVNKGLANLTELWNLVFIQFNRGADGAIRELPKKHVDTGMGLERLTAVLQGTMSNYDTDLFTSLFEIIKKNCKNIPPYSGRYDDPTNLDTSYRILADHARMITVCLSDGMIPEQNQKLRKILRKTLNISATAFKTDQRLLKHLTVGVCESLQETYLELERNIRQVHEIIEYESELYETLRNTASKEWRKIVEGDCRLRGLDVMETSGLISAYNDLKGMTGRVDGGAAFRLYDTHGLDSETISELCGALGLAFDPLDFEVALREARARTRDAYRVIVDEVVDVAKTDDAAKYDDEVDATVLKVVTKGDTFLILDRTCLYTEAGGQVGDLGQIVFDNGILSVTDVVNVNGWVFHRVSGEFAAKSGDVCRVYVDEKRRKALMSNHTATHLLNRAIKDVIGGASCQKSSLVTPEYLSFDVGTYSGKITMQQVENIENTVRDVIKKQLRVETKLINSQQLATLTNVTLIPGEIYPEHGIRLVEVGDSVEPCCGTHVTNTGDIGDFCIVGMKSLGRSTVSFTAVTGPLAIAAFAKGRECFEAMRRIEDSDGTDFKDVDEKITDYKRSIADANDIPVYTKNRCLEILNETSRRLRNIEREQIKDLIGLEMKSVVDANAAYSKKKKKYIVHFLECSCILDNVPLQHATKICPNMPVLVISYSENIVKARCCVPRPVDNFNADSWMKSVSEVFKTSHAAPKGQDGRIVVNMKAKKIKLKDWDIYLARVLQTARKFAHDNL